VLARDRRTPEKTGTAQITIRVEYDDNAPRIENSLNGVITGFISENVEIGTSIEKITAVDQDIIEDGQVSLIKLFI
jgi:hypothetical protein